MYEEAVKKWTILIYADGNNEMESVIYKSLLACEKVGSNDEVNVVFQIGRLGNYKADEEESWSGVRRYYVDNCFSTLVEDLGKSNMADPNNLYDFIKWGFDSYKSEHYMVVLSDHGGDFIGCFTDESFDEPYIMGIPEMFEAVNAVKKLDFQIDVLVLDMCYMNTVEVLYELGKEPLPAVKTVATYMDFAAYEGIDYDKLIYYTEEYSSIDDLNLFIKNLLDSLDYNLIAFELDNSKLEEIKRIFDKTASLYCTDRKIENPLDTVNKIIINPEQEDFVKDIHNLLSSMLIYSKIDFKGLNISIKVTSKDIGQLIAFYRKLGFSKNNCWTLLLSSIPFSMQKRNTDRVNVALSDSSPPIPHNLMKFNVKN